MAGRAVAPPQMLDSEQTAALMQISLRQLRRLRESGAITYVKVGREVRYDPIKDIARFLDRNRRAS